MDTNSFVRSFSRFLNPSLWMMALLCMVCSCSNEENSSLETFGHVTFNVSFQPDTVNLSGRTVALTMASADGLYSHTWADIRDFSVLESFYAGMYSAKAVLGKEGAEGYDCECYIGQADFEIMNNKLSTVNLECTLSQAKIKAVAAEVFLERFSHARIVTHTAGAAYVDVAFGDDRVALVTPGSTSVFLCLDDAVSGGIMIETGLVIDTSADTDYLIEINLSDEVLSVSAGMDKVEIPLDNDVMISAAPVVTCSGFVSGQEVSLTEGMPAGSSIVMTVESEIALRKVILTSLMPDEASEGLPSECNLLGECGEYIAQGLSVVSDNDRSIRVDFTHLLENLSVVSVSDICFMLQAVDVFGRASEVAVLRTSIKGVEMSVVGTTKAFVGINTASVTLHVNVPEVEGSDFEISLDDRTTPDLEPLEIISTSMNVDSRLMTIEFRVPEGISSLPIRIDYMGRPKLSVDIERSLPDFTFSVDAYANTVVASIDAPTEAETAAITKYARIMAGGNEMAVLNRDTERGYLYCSGFKADTRYDVECVVLKDAVPKKCAIRTEVAAQVPDGSFEDVAEVINYGNFPSGGTYSSTSFPIFNQQNFVDVNVKWPKKYWASINAKTFCQKAEMHNTWYMQPSSAIDFDYFTAGSKSMRMSSVGWSLHGQEIKPYVQPVDAFEPYNSNYPPIDNISAGYLFLGYYSFNPTDLTEVTIEGVKFESRPSSLNGFFKYVPDEGNPSDRGWVRVELINEGPAGEVSVIGSGYLEFPYAPDFRSFNIPITYTTYFTPATRLKILFCSSVYSEGLSFDDPEVPVTADIPNSRYIGSTLWVDNLSFSY